MPHFAKPAEGSWTEHYPELGTSPVDYTDSVDPAYYAAERAAIFRRTWLNVGRVEQVAKTGSYFTKELAVAGTSLIIVRGKDGQIRAFHNMCRHPGGAARRLPR
jgi:phenylpropionate dioxygenase-like ring-hydroxylating dioxygenase large terminal subunit